ncbi:uncharacterized protein MONBRDRAFT_8097 [Monosiga brevicollis MX1]|uniref:Uncharacterized protein n=1 Tax=Monosiga brevicollis TaxID=81824 RepID=A9UZ16_MONBE|nr:uncharacterized protein MONBRDRAFT_8097 [Monosiga brevicollis MX1]EDQ89706.1 predicted protein [Monosiga brevicollis MX1]|eukprot:XP_001745735.1 hypothetical protein [Monosiga brevicollis MX1]
MPMSNSEQQTGFWPSIPQSTRDVLEMEVADFPSRHVETLAAATVIIRFVNGLVDQRQQAVMAHSVNRLARELGIPEWLVDLRHDATHGELPSHSLVLAAVDTIKTWLHDRYWAPQAEMVVHFEARVGELATLIWASATSTNPDPTLPALPLQVSLAPLSNVMTCAQGILRRGFGVCFESRSSNLFDFVWTLSFGS